MSYLIIILIMIASISSAILVGSSDLNIEKYENKLTEAEILSDFNSFELAINSYKKGLNVYPSNEFWEEDLKRLNLRIPKNNGYYKYSYESNKIPALEKVGICYFGKIEKSKFISIANIHLKGTTVLSDTCFSLNDSEIDFTQNEIEFSITRWVKVNWQSVNPLEKPEAVLTTYFEEINEGDTDTGGTGGGNGNGGVTPNPEPPPTPPSNCITKNELRTLILNGDNVEDVNTSCITDFTSMFENINNFNQNLSKWNTSNATNFKKMFKNTKNFNGLISNWDTSNVKNFSEIFYKAEGLGSNISNWDTSNVTNFYRAFRDTNDFNQDISKWNVSSGTQFNQMFRNSLIFNQDLSNWNVGNGKTFKNMFQNAREFNSDINSWNMSNATNVASMFKRATKFNSNLNKWNLNKLTSANSMFMYAESFDKDLSSWNTRNIRNYHNMFNGAKSFSYDISSWDVKLANKWKNFNFNSGLTIEKIPEKFRTQLLINDVIYIKPFKASEVESLTLIRPRENENGISLFTWTEASDFCNSLNYWGYNEWYLPSIDEIIALYTEVGAVSNMPYGWSTDYYYWTNTLGERNHYSVNLLNGLKYEENENEYNHVICVRY